MEVEAIFGPPGTGKTRTLVDLAAQAPGDGLYLSFTKAAATEATSRLPAGRIKASTIHSLAFNALNMNRAAVVDSAKLADFGRMTGFPFKGSEYGSDEPQEGDEYATVLAFANNQRMHADKAYDKLGCPGTRSRFHLFLESYTSWKRNSGYMDFDDMLWHYIQSEHRPRKQWVFLDEAQDCSPLQWMAFDRAIEGAERVYIGGDDDQAIYEWNGANPHGMVEFVAQHNGTKRVLDQSYRVPKIVHAKVHDKLLKHISQREPKAFKPTQDEGISTGYGDFHNVDIAAWAEKGGLILCRDRWRQEEIKRALNRELIPYDVYGGYSPYTSRIAQALKRGETPEIPPAWQTFYRQADLSAPIRVHVATIHQAKGREADRVIVDLELSQKVLANLYLSRDPELRVMYVALTRARSELITTGSNPLL